MALVNSARGYFSTLVRWRHQYDGRKGRKTAGCLRASVL